LIHILGFQHHNQHARFTHDHFKSTNNNNKQQQPNQQSTINTIWTSILAPRIENTPTTQTRHPIKSSHAHNSIITAVPAASDGKPTNTQINSFFSSSLNSAFTNHLTSSVLAQRLRLDAEQHNQHAEVMVGRTRWIEQACTAQHTE
jgi:hypothetical protein